MAFASNLKSNLINLHQRHHVTLVGRALSKNKPFGAFALCFLLLVATTSTFAQVRREALWRVENSLPSQPAPLFEGQASPFPIKQPPPPPEPEVLEAPEVVTAPPEPQLTPQQRAQQRRAEQAASMMSRIRDMLNNEDGFAADFSGVVVEAIVSGASGKMALINGKWRFEGDFIQTPVQTKSNMMNLLGKLNQADENLAGIVEEEISKKRAALSPLQILIKDIQEDAVTLRVPDGGVNVISFRSEGW